jgi:hypothetical protein
MTAYGPDGKVCCDATIRGIRDIKRRLIRALDV